MGCPGCHGKGSEEGVPTFGHILGCGSIRFPDRGRSNPFDRKEQERILMDVLLMTLKQVKGPLTDRNVKEFVSKFGPNLQEILHARPE